ncbi:hypothetical protein [Tabrizicola sp.]|uniref:hypothetical protein n=1 Tax=Tabrizicola sp. TaxID=2005166 RepID=UPI003D2D7328
MNDCANTGFIPRTKVTLEYGELKMAQTFVRRQWEPADEKTRAGLLEFAKALGVAPLKPTSKKKVVRCLSDLCVAVRRSPNGLIAWQTGSAELIGLPYGQDIAAQVKNGLKDNGLITIEQKSAKSKELARIYQLDRSICSPDYKFKQHKDWHPVEVRSPKTKAGRKTVGGSPLGRRRFVGQIEPLEHQMYRLNRAMADQPLRSDDGHEFIGCRRIFNNGSLLSGGRVYGDWQGLSEDQRLQLKIGGEPVCEIDIKACYVAIAYSQFGKGELPEDDPYSSVMFVTECNDPERRKQLRTACKLLVVAYLGKQGELTKYPRAKKKQGGEKAISFKKRFDLGENVDFYMNQIKDAHPALVAQKAYGDDLMYRESSMVVDAMMTLLGLGVVSYPVHDCLIVPINHKDKAIEVLSDTMRDHLGFVPAMDVAYLDHDGQKVETTISVQGVGGPEGRQQHSRVILDWGLSEDFDLIEDWDDLGGNTDYLVTPNTSQEPIRL